MYNSLKKILFITRFKMSGPNTIDYSNLNKALQPKRKIEGVTTDVAKAIWDIFLAKNAPRTKKVENKNQKLSEFSSDIENWSESMKLKFSLTIDHLSKNWLLNPESIKSLKIRWDSTDEKLQNIIDDLVINRKTPLTDNQKTQLDQAIANWMEKHYSDLVNKDDISDELKKRNEELEEELNASEAANEVVESAVLTRRSMNNTIRVWKSIERINENKKWLDPVTKARKVLWQANSFAVFGSWKRFDWINKLPKKIDVNKEYREAVDNLKDKMDKTKSPKEKVAIRYIMRQVNKAYKDYIDATNISEETRKQNMKDINMKMAA